MPFNGDVLRTFRFVPCSRMARLDVATLKWSRISLHLYGASVCFLVILFDFRGNLQEEPLVLVLLPEEQREIKCFLNHLVERDPVQRCSKLQPAVPLVSQLSRASHL